MQRFGNVWKMWKRETTRGRMGPGSKFKFFTIRHRIPNSVKRATVRFWSHNRITLTGWADSAIDNTLTFSHAIPSPDLTTNLHVIGDQTNDISPYLIHGDVNIVCDGSFLPESKIGAASWVIESKDELIQLTGSTSTTGSLDCQTACRSELFSIFYSILHLQQLCQSVHLQTISFNIHCDGLSAIQSIDNSSSDNNCTKKNFDILNSIHILLRSLPFKIELHHIKGHQDSSTAFHSLSKLAQLNVLADDNAKQKAHSLLSTGHHHQTSSLPFSPIDIFVTTHSGQRKKVCSSRISSLRDEITKGPSRDYWIRKKNLELLSTQVDWDLRATSIRNVPKHEQRLLCKFTTGFCGVGSMLLKYKYQTHTKCPRCGHDNEHTDHVLQCPAEGCSSAWNEEIQKLKKWMDTQDLHPEISNIILTSLHCWRQHKPFSYSTSNPHLQRALLTQKRIG